uniref:Uncharacterized protein n=1 Tax=viral metagenome TaxID=1070528 RepID=A0A6H1ZLY3_9ZZZZ
MFDEILGMSIKPKKTDIKTNSAIIYGQLFLMTVLPSRRIQYARVARIAARKPPVEDEIKSPKKINGVKYFHRFRKNAGKQNAKNADASFLLLKNPTTGVPSPPPLGLNIGSNPKY